MPSPALLTSQNSLWLNLLIVSKTSAAAGLVPRVSTLPYSYIPYPRLQTWKHQMQLSLLLRSILSFYLADPLVLAAVVPKFLSPGSLWAHHSRLAITPTICYANKIANRLHGQSGSPSNLWTVSVLSKAFPWVFSVWGGIGAHRTLPSHHRLLQSLSPVFLTTPAGEDTSATDAPLGPRNITLEEFWQPAVYGTCIIQLLTLCCPAWGQHPKPSLSPGCRAAGRAISLFCCPEARECIQTHSFVSVQAQNIFDLFFNKSRGKK